MTSLCGPQLGEGCGVKETPQQKYQRLVNEIQELVQEVDTIQVSDTLEFSASGPWLTGLAGGCLSLTVWVWQL